MSVDDMLWWLYDKYKIVVGTRTIRRVFERKGDKVKPTRGKQASRRGTATMAEDDDDDEDDDDEDEEDQSAMQVDGQYQSPYAPMQAAAQSAEAQLVQALQQQQTPQPYPVLANMSEEAEDEETIQLQLQQIELQKREVELKLKMRRLQTGKGTSSKIGKAGTPNSAPSTLFNPTVAMQPTPQKRDSRSKKKIEESKRRTAERQERMLRDLERRSRRRDHLTAEWVQSKDIWPLRAQGLLADLMHQYGCYAYSQNHVDTFEGMYGDLYQLVDLSKGDWVPQIHDDLLRERMKRKMGQLRTKMQKTGEIISRGDPYGGWQKAENYTGEQAGATVGDESEMNVQDGMHADNMQAEPGASQVQMHDPQLAQYEPVPDHHHQQMQAQQMPYGAAPMMQHQTPQYPMMPPQPHGMMPYAQMEGQQGMPHTEGMVGM